MPLHPTLFLGAQDVVELIRNKGLVTTLRDVARTIHEDFLRWDDFDKAARIANHSPLGVIELMPIADAHTYTFKYVNGHPANTARGLPTVMAFGVLADVATGMPLLVSELTLITAIRTAATSVVAAQALARPESRSMALIGNGAQAEFQALAFHCLMGIDEIRLYDTDPFATEKLVAHLRQSPDAANLRLKVCTSAAQAVQGADIVTTVTADKRNAVILTADMLEPGMHLNAVGGDCPGKTELAPEVMQAAWVFVEYEPQSRIEGELQHMPADFAVTELWQVLHGDVVGRNNEEDITLFDSVGFALEDFSALRYIYALARANKRGHALQLVPDLADPKDLYASLAPAPDL
ncbi:MAG: ornithine cyclodeaminase [Brachymonas sp.]|nr:ornithine cyclodeaminase [Brachymonas sp.]